MSIDAREAVAGARRAKSRTAVSRLDYLRELRRLATSLTQVELARNLGVSQPTISDSLKTAAKVAEPRAGFSGADPYEIAQRYAAGVGFRPVDAESDESDKPLSDGGVSPRSVAVSGSSADHGRVPHRRDCQVPQRVVVRALTLPAALPEPSGGPVRAVPVCARTPLPAQIRVGGEVEAEDGVRGVKLQGSEAVAGEVLVLVDLDERARRRMQVVAPQGREAFGALLDHVTAERVEDPLEDLRHGAGLSRQTQVATLVEPRDTGALEHQGVGRSCYSERSLALPNGHASTLLLPAARSAWRGHQERR